MALISLLTRLVNGVQRQVDLSTNTLVVADLQVGGVLLSGTSGSTKVGDAGGYTNITPTAATVRGALLGIDTALGAVGTNNANKTLSNLDSPTAVNQDLLPANRHTQNLGASLQEWLTLWVSNIQDASGTGAYIDVANHALVDGPGNNSLDWDLRQLFGPDGSTIALDWSSAGVLNANSSILSGLANPVSAQDAVTLSYLNARLSGLKPKQSVLVATTANITLSGEQTIDGVLTSGSRVLVWQQTAPENNGIYVSAAGAWARSADFDSLSPIDEINGAWVAIQQGTVHAGQVFVQYGTVATLGTDPINFEYYNPVAGLIGGDMITFTGSTFSVDLATVSGLESTNPGNVAGQLRVKLEASNPSLKITGSNELAAKLDPAGALVAGAAGIAAAVDGASLEINSNALRVKSTAYDQVTITGGGGSAAAVAQAPVVAWTEVAGQAFSANVTVAVRYGLVSNGETAGRIYAADIATGSFDLFNVIGFIQPTSAVSIAGSVSVISDATLTLLSGDTNFGSTDTGKALFLQTNGVQATIVAPTSSGSAVLRLGFVKTTTSFRVQIGSAYVA